jgi:hypothetical protein
MIRQQRQNTRKTGDGESGVALILVLGIVVLVSLLVLSALAISQGSGRLSKISRDRIAAAYQAEGGSDMAYWVLSEDIRLHPNRALGTVGDTVENERVMADGRLHSLGTIDDFAISYRVMDAASGLDVTGGTPERQFAFYPLRASALSDADTAEAAKAFIGALGDYVDSNNLLRAVGGFETDDYANAGMSPLPRNGQMQYREEALWIPGAARFIQTDASGALSTVRLIPPRGLRAIRGKSSFFSATPNDLALRTTLSEDDLDLVLKARQAWFSDGAPITDRLSPEIISNLRRVFSFKESGYYTVYVEVKGVTDGTRRVFTSALRIYSRFHSGSVARYYDWRFLQ